ncbi:MAG TPA: ethylbenzene dehydrogenase-related protein, partial [Deferrisomatales bacterium]|nr:ethylbenzene dehydrogenase-related protein [Deferrisomatales bacterium]
AAEAAVAVEPPPQAPVGRSPVVRESTATAAPAQAEAPRPASRTQAEMDFKAAREAGTLQALTRFLDTHPDSPYSPEAEQRASELRERAAYTRARERDDVAGYRGFLENFPESRLRGEVEVRAQALEESQRRQESEKRNRADAAKRLRAAYDETRKLDSPEAYQIFLAAYPNSTEAVAAKKRLATIEADEEAFRGAHGSEERLDSYLTQYPDGRHADEARSELQTLRGRRMEADYRTTLAAGTAEAFRAFLKQWPRSPRSREAGEALASLERSGIPEPPRAGGHPAETATSAAQLIAPRVTTPPTVDGNGADPGWAGAPNLVTPLHGAAGADKLEVRAVHDGQTVYFLLRWGDPTRDTVNRPWNWSPADKTYHQGQQLDDGVSVMLFGDTAPGDACMLAGGGWQGDSWTWRANWSNLAGLADDGVMRGSVERLPQSNPYPAADGNGQVWISRHTDEGTPGWSFYIPLDFEGPVVGSYQAAKARGSRADVAAQGQWSEARENPTWTVEFSRALDTRHSDDQPLQIGRPTAVAFAVYDQADKANHSVSSLIRLILKKEQP